MEQINQKTKAWKSLMKQLEQVVDPILRNSMKAEFTKRAIREWGYNPETGELLKDDEFSFDDLDDWEKEFFKDIQDMITYQIDTRKEKREAEEKELRKNMYFFIKGGGGLADIPSDVRTDYIVKIYLETLKKVYDIE